MTQPLVDDRPVPVRLKLSALWTALMFCYIYGDYFGLYVPGKLEGMLAGRGPIGPVSEGTLVATALMLAVPGIMVFLSLVLPPAAARWTNIGLGLFFIAIMLLTMPGAWSFYLVLGTIEILLNVLTVWTAWTWPREVSA